MFFGPISLSKRKEEIVFLDHKIILHIDLYHIAKNKYYKISNGLIN